MHPDKAALRNRLKRVVQATPSGKVIETILDRDQPSSPGRMEPVAVLHSLQWSVATMGRRTSLSGVENGLSGREESGGGSIS